MLVLGRTFLARRRGKSGIRAHHHFLLTWPFFWVHFQTRPHVWSGHLQQTMRCPTPCYHARLARGFSQVLRKASPMRKFCRNLSWRTSLRQLIWNLWNWTLAIWKQIQIWPEKTSSNHSCWLNVMLQLEYSLMLAIGFVGDDVPFRCQQCCGMSTPRRVAVKLTSEKPGSLGVFCQLMDLHPSKWSTCNGCWYEINLHTGFPSRKVQTCLIILAPVV